MRGRAHPVLAWIALVLGLAVCVGIGYGAYQLAGYSWDQVAAYDSPYVGMLDTPLPTEPVAEPSSPRVVLVIVDGLREDAARTMNTLNTLQEYGSDFVLETPQPSLSYPDWTAILTGAPHHVTGVTTNWWEGPVRVPTILDTALSAGIKTVVVGPTDFVELYGVDAADGSSLMDWPKPDAGGVLPYLSADLIDDALSLVEVHDPAFVLIHLPDTDEAAHRFGGDSDEYRQTVLQVDSDLARLVTALQDEPTTFVITADHGHIDTGGHGGWEPESIRVRAVLGGPGVALSEGEGRLVQIAPTVSALMGLEPPAYSYGAALEGVLADAPQEVGEAARVQQARFARAYVGVLGGDASGVPTGSEAAAMTTAERAFIRRGQNERLLLGLGALGACIVPLIVIGIASRRALLAALTGAAAYTALYNLLFFVVHGYHWSLSAFNTEDMVEAFMNGRLIEAAVSMLFAAAVAGAVYPMLRAAPKRASGPYLPGWLALGPATALAVLAVLGLQVAWYVWAWGMQVTALLPDLMWGFKYDLDLLQATAVGFAAVLTPLVTFLVGRYHPRVRVARAGAVESVPAEE